MQKKSPSAHHRTTFALSSQLRHLSTIGKNLLNSNMSSTCLQNMANFGPLTAEIGLPVWGTGFASCGSCLRYCSDVPHQRRANQTLHDVNLAVSWAGTLTYTFGGSCPDRILPGAKFTLRASLTFAYIGSVTARHASSGREPNFAVGYKEWNYGTFAEGASHATYIRLGGHHVGHGPTF